MCVCVLALLCDVYESTNTLNAIIPLSGHSLYEITCFRCCECICSGQSQRHGRKCRTRLSNKSILHVRCVHPQKRHNQHKHSQNSGNHNKFSECTPKQSAECRQMLRPFLQLVFVFTTLLGGRLRRYSVARILLYSCVCALRPQTDAETEQWVCCDLFPIECRTELSAKYAQQCGNNH